MFIQNIASTPEKKTDDDNMIATVLPFKDQIAANAICRQLRDLSIRIAVKLQPVILSKKLRKKESRILLVSIAEHKYSAIGKYLLEVRGGRNLLNGDQFRVFKKCHGKLDLLVYEKLFIKELSPGLNTRSDSFLPVLNSLFSLQHASMLTRLMNCCFSCIYTLFVCILFFFSLDNDVREQQNVVYF